MMLKEKILGQRVYLRSLNIKDASEEYVGWLNDPEVNKFLVIKGTDLPSLIAYIVQKNARSDALFLGIFLNNSGGHIGTIKLEPIDHDAGIAVIAVMVGDKKYWGQGLGSEAIKLLIDHSQSELGMKRIELGVFGENSAAISAYAKLGFVEVGREVQAVRSGDHVYDQVTMALELIPNLKNL
jgi:RimJ/RimL family protein N-acetyltransferase